MITKIMLFTKRQFSIQKTKLFSSLFENYIQRDETVKPFYKYHLSQKDFEAFFVEEHFNYLNRPVLVESLLKQSQLVTNTSSKTIESIQILTTENTFTVTTGHQLCLFSGPLYFIYKIISAINLCKTLTEKFPSKNFVPVYWMASEDHDFEEINHANVFGKKIVWNSEEKGSVGNFKTKNLADVIVELKTILGDNENATHLIKLFEDAYLKNENLADAIRFLVNELFGEYGLITLDGNDKTLKELFQNIVDYCPEGKEIRRKKAVAYGFLQETKIQDTTSNSYFTRSPYTDNILKGIDIPQHQLVQILIDYQKYINNSEWRKYILQKEEDLRRKNMKKTFTQWLKA